MDARRWRGRHSFPRGRVAEQYLCAAPHVLGWQLEHALGYFIATLIVCLAWPRPLKVAGAMIGLHVVLEGLQALNPDRHPNLFAVVYGTAGVLAAALLAEFLIRVRHRKA